MLLGSGKKGLTSEALEGVLKETWFRGHAYGFARYFTDRAHDSRSIQLDISRLQGTGMMPATAPTSSTTVIGSRAGVSRISYGVQDWREKKEYDASDVVKLRRLGTLDEDDPEAASTSQLIASGLLELRARLENRLEKLRVDSLVEGEIVYRLVNGSMQQVAYPVPSNLQKTLLGGDRWSETTATPADDIKEWAEEFNDLAVSNLYELTVTPAVNRALRNTDQWKQLGNAIFQNTGNPNWVAGRLESDFVIDQTTSAFLSAYVGQGVTYHVYRGSTQGVSEVVIDAASGATTLTLDSIIDLGRLEAGDTISLVNRAVGIINERVTVASVAGNVVTLDAPLGSAVPRGTQVVKRVHFMDQSKILFAAKFDERETASRREDSLPLFENGRGQITPTTGASMMYAPNEYDLNNLNKSGVFVKYNDLGDNDPPRAEVVLGTAALPRIDYTEFFLRATVL